MTKGAVLVERRSEINIDEVIDNHFRYLGKDWGCTVYGTKEVLAKVDNDRVNYTCELPEGSLTCYEDYNKLMTGLWFWESIPYDKVLIFHPDSMLLREGIDNFIHFDYCGAPWGHFKHVGGNGGLSIRTKSKMIEVINKVKYDIKVHGNEDLYFSKYVHKFGGNVAPMCEAMKFSVETIFYPKPIGCHAPEKYLTKEQVGILYSAGDNINMNDVIYD
jgi:hypothetical protein